MQVGDIDGSGGASGEVEASAGVVSAVGGGTGTEEACSEPTLSTELMEALLDDELCNHFLSEPAVAVDTKFQPRVVRVGPPTNGVDHHIRPPAVGFTVYRKQQVLWAMDKFGEDLVCFARVCHLSGEWSKMLTASTMNGLARLILQATGAGKKARVSAPLFFGETFFKELANKRYAFPAPPANAKCFLCGAGNQNRWRFDETTLARKCEGCRTRRKKNVETSEIDEGLRLLSSDFLQAVQD